jgi:predicted PurR-regulated permease PerM
MSDGVRTALVWIGIVTGALGVICALTALSLSSVRKRLQDSTIPRTIAITIMLLCIAAVAGGAAWIWPHPPQ